jgi:hypothetical protein
MSNMKHTNWAWFDKFDALKVEFIIEWFKEMARIALAAALPIFITVFNDGAITNDEWKALYIAASLAVAKGIDRALHETKVAEKGILRF